MNSDLEIFLEIVQKWPSNIYTIKSIIKSIERLLPSAKDPKLVQRILVELFSRDKQHDKAVFYGMTLRLPGQMELVEQHKLIDFVKDNILLLLSYERDIVINSRPERLSLDALVQGKALNFMMTHTDHIQPSYTVKILQKEQQLLFAYLDALFQKDVNEGSLYHNMQVGLYAEYAPGRLLDFLRTSQFYSYPEVLHFY